MTRAEAIAHILRAPEDATIFVLAVTPDIVVERFDNDNPQLADRTPLADLRAHAANAIMDYQAPSIDDEVGIVNDLACDLYDELTIRR